MSKTIETSVIIVGGSIVGLATSAFLAYHKVPHVLVEKHAGSAAHPRAVGFTTRTIELLRMIDADGQVQGATFDRPPRRVQVESLAGKWEEETLWSGKKPQGPSPGTKGGPNGNIKALSPVSGVALSQDKMEPVFRKRALELGAEHYLGWKMTSCFQDEASVTVTAVNKANEEIKVQAKYLIAADGSASPLRESLNITRQGVGRMRTISSIMFRCESILKYLEKGFSQFQIKSDGFEAFMVSYPDGRWALMIYDQDHSKLEQSAQKALVRKAIGEDLSDSEIEIVAHGNWDLAALISDKFQTGRIFLAGDAAHSLPPTRGGYGANTGILDGHDLAWKLASVLSGESAPSLLDTYESERRPVALTRHDQVFARPDYSEYLKTSAWQLPHGTTVIDDTAMELGQLYKSSAIIGSQDSSLPVARTPVEWAGQPGTRAAHFWVDHNEQRKSILDLFYKSWIVLSKDKNWAEIVHEAAKESGITTSFVQIGAEAVEEDEGEFETLYGIGKAGAVLIRPDGYIAWRSVDGSDEVKNGFAAALSKVAHAQKK